MVDATGKEKLLHWEEEEEEEEEEYDDGSEPMAYDKLEIRFDKDFLFVTYREVCEKIQILCAVK